MDTFTVWKRIYPIIAAKNPNVTEDIVEDVLDICKQHITKVFLPFEFYTKESFIRWKQMPGLTEIVSDDEMCKFVNNLSRELDLNTTAAWTVICNFLMYEYFGKVDELKTLIKFDTKIEYLTENIWYFYTADRMFLLKTLRHILENADNVKDPYYEKFQLFMKDVDINALWKTLFSVFNNLIHEISKDKIHMVPAGLLKEWINRNNREQLEVLLLMMQMLKWLKLNGSELERLLLLFIRHGFTRHPLYADSSKISKQEDLLQVVNCEIALVLAIMDRYWRLPELNKKLPEKMEKSLEPLLIRGDSSIILFASAVFKISCGNKEKTDVEQYNTIIEQMLENKIFVSIYQLLTHRIFLYCKAGENLTNAVLTLMEEYSKNSSDFKYLYEQEGVVKIVAELIKRKGLVVLHTLGPIFQLAVETFPYAFEPFLEICQSLLSISEKYDDIMKLIKAVPGFLSETTWDFHSDMYITNRPKKLFMDSNLFVVPPGTMVDKYVYQNMELSRFHYVFSLYLLMEQFTKSFNAISFEIGSSQHSYKSLSTFVYSGFKFIHYILKLYKGDYREDTELRTLVKRLEIIPAHLFEGHLTNFKFIKLYFSVNCTLIKRDLLDLMEVFTPIQRKRFMPSVTSYSKETRDSLYSQLHNKSLLYQNLTKEEGFDTHELLIEYLELIYYMVQKNIHQYEVQLPGMWYIISFVFPLHRQWHYKDTYECVTITNLCISIFIEVLKRNLSPKNDDSNMIFELIIDAFFFYDTTMTSFVSVFSKPKFDLQILMEDESDWNNGPALQCVECLRLHLVLLLLLYKHKARMNKKINILDHNVGFFAKGVAPHIINPYSLPLRKLSCRFLELLSRDQNIPLMALLGLDYDQVQRLYLDRLRDSTEDDDLKIHILDLIGTSVVYQHGMTAAFFNVKRSRKWYSDNKEKTIEGDTVSDFMVEYLQNIKKSPEFLRSPLQIGILNVMSNLWTSRKTHLIDDVIALKEFWPLLSNPFYREFDQSPKVYAYILQIYVIQLTKAENDSKFLTSLNKFITNKVQVTRWIDYILTTFKEQFPSVEDIEDKQFLLKSWMEFTIMLEKNKELKKLDQTSKYEFISTMLDGFKLPLVNTHCLKSWTDLIFLQFRYWEKLDMNEHKSLAEKVISAMSVVKLYYNDLPHDARVSVLAFIQEIIQNFHDHFESASHDLMELLEQFGLMLDHEYTVLEEKEWKHLEDVFDSTVREHLLPWMLCVRITSGLLEMKNVEDVASWFVFRNLVVRLIDSTCELIQHSPTLPLAKSILHCLALYMESPVNYDFLNINISNFLTRLVGPIMSLLFGQNNKISPLQLEEGWIICSLLMKFHTSYFKTFQYIALPTYYTFVILSENILGHIFNILDTTVALKALDLVINTLKLFDMVLDNWSVEWYTKSSNTYVTILNGVKKIVNACLYAILRPKNVTVYMLDESNRMNQLEKYPVELMVATVNRLVTTVGLGFSIFYKINPGLVTLLNPIVFDIPILVIDNDFSVPKFELPIPSKLTFGMLLCLAHFLCKTLDALKLNKPVSATPLHPEYFSRCFGMIEHQGYPDHIPYQKLSTYLRYVMYQYTGLADPWIQQLDCESVKFSLESLMMLLSQQIFIEVQTVHPESVSYLKRNLSSELQFFYEHVKKITSILINLPSTPQLSQATQSETDILRKYLLHCNETLSFGELVDDNFCIIFSYWFTNICKLK